MSLAGLSVGAPALVTIVGAILCLFAHGRWSDIGRMAFGAGLLAMLLAVR